MSKRDQTVRLRHMLDHAKEAVFLVRGKSRKGLDSDRLLNLALVRLVEIIGEAAARVPRPTSCSAALRFRPSAGVPDLVLWFGSSEGPLPDGRGSVLTDSPGRGS